MFAIMFNFFSFIPSILPPMNVIYQKKIVLPSVSPFDIIYERIEDNRAEIQVTGNHKMFGNIYYDENYNSIIDIDIRQALESFDCSLLAVDYNNMKDVIELVIQFEYFIYVKPKKKFMLRCKDENNLII